MNLMCLLQELPASQAGGAAGADVELWPELSNYGRKASQFVDLLGYFSLKAPYSVGKVGTA